ncbi:NADH-ubiquinone oxidoreductase-F iron-sulfur binding region domain-containing protein [Candidatus Chlorohelix sp.]|uniref:NADH-ubiquinone oxidoreductase-F iron-sulfur binding region domain-containing protein n=1 Tax=Candidatus Chlorohelix sp. TaxID=3139201 RepID=UPI003049B40F
MNRQQFHELQARLAGQRKALFENNTVIQVMMDGGSILSGAKQTYEYFKKEIASRGLQNVVVKMVGSFGAMWADPTVFISKPGSPRVLYGFVDTKRAGELLTRFVLGDDPCANWSLGWVSNDPYHYPDFAWAKAPDEEWRGILPIGRTEWGKLQHRISGRNLGFIDPEDIEDYIAIGGYKSLEKALLDMDPQKVIDEVKASKLRGRGGAGFSVGTKWQSTHDETRMPKYVVVNGHEGEPNVFKDRRLFEGDPHSILEGLLLGCYAAGTGDAYIYVGSEHPLSFKRIGIAVEQARKAGFLGKNILGSSFSCDVKVIIAAGCYISGEASAMLYGIQGLRGMPRVKPPRSYEAGLWAQPTTVNNVESFNNVPEIILRGGAWYAGFGSEKSKGTKLIMLSGPFKRQCLAEVPFGGPISDSINIVGGGSSDPKHPIRAVQTGSVSGGCFPPSMFNIPFDIDAFGKWDCLLGSGSFTAYTDQQCLVDAAYYVLRYNRDESCGKCVPCRIGNEGLTEMLWRIKSGDGKEEDVEKMLQISDLVIEHSICGLGQAAPLPIRNMLKIPEFKAELMEHIINKRCRANVCSMDHADNKKLGFGTGVRANHQYK